MFSLESDKERYLLTTQYMIIVQRRKHFVTINGKSYEFTSNRGNLKTVASQKAQRVFEHQFMLIHQKHNIFSVCCMQFERQKMTGYEF